VAASSRLELSSSKLACFSRFDHVSYWLSRTRDLVANAETYTFPAFLESFRELRQESRRAEFALLLALYKFQLEMEAHATDANKR
jgi:hypothetical protein